MSKKEKSLLSEAPCDKDKDNQIFFTHPIRQRIFELFLSGGKYSVVDLSIKLNIPDPRSHIRYIRKAGVPISDYWEKSRYSRHKIYFIHLDRKSCGVQKVGEVIRGIVKGVNL